MKNRICLLFTLLMVTLLFGCGQTGSFDDLSETRAEAADWETQSPQETVAVIDDPVVLRVLTEFYQEYSPEMAQIAAAIDAFNATHGEIQIEHMMLPDDVNERDAQIQQLQIDVTRGGGPDIFLLPAEKTLHAYGYIAVLEPLFPDLNLAMREGCFADLSAYYNEDVDLDASGLEPAVMEAGVVDGYRFLLPMQYEIPVAYVNLSAPELVGCSTLGDYMDACLLSGRENAFKMDEFKMLYRFLLDSLPEPVDYGGMRTALTENPDPQVLLQPNELAYHLQTYYDWYSTYAEVMRGEKDFSLEAYQLDIYWARNGGLMRFGTMEDAVLQAALAELNGIELGMIPLTGPDNTLTAKVTFFGAVNAGCCDPEAGYVFLQLFLTEEYQWETTDFERDVWAVYDYVTNRYGWPVRSLGAVTNGYENTISRYALGLRDNLELMDGLRALHLTDADIPILETPINAARLPMGTMEFQLMEDLRALREKGADAQDFQYLAESFLQELELRLTER